MSRKEVMLTRAVILFLAVALPCQVICAEEDQDNNLFGSFDSDVIHLKSSRLADLCQYLRYQALPYYWPKERTADLMKKRGYMGIEIPDFITDGTQGQQQGSQAGGPKPRYYKNG